MNFADSEVVGAILTGAGYALCEAVEEADFVLINTCAIRDNAEQRVRHRVRELRAMQNRHANLRVGILGCMAERLQSRLMAEEDNVSFVCGPDAYRRLPDLLRQRRHAGILHQRRQILPYGQELPGHDRREAGHAGGGHGAGQGEV